jgi:DNA repair protein SbcD/Mre11
VILAHLADLHLGFRQFHRQTPAGLNQREADVAHAFRTAIDQIIAAKPDAVLVAGDLFHSVRPTNPAILFAFRQFHRLKTELPNAPLVVIAGNHDSPRSVETGSILALFETLGATIVADQSRRLVFPELDLSVLCVPHAAVVGGERNFRPEGNETNQVLLLHGAIPGLYAWEKHAPEYGGSLVTTEDLTRGNWSYVALGHYHVQREVAPGVWYSGALDYVSPNPWGELTDEENHRIPGKGWLKVELPRRKVTRMPVPLARKVLDLLPLDATGRTAAELDTMIATAIEGIRGGYADQIIRQVIRNVPRHLGRELNYTAIRTIKAQALHYHLDLRRPDVRREVGVGSPGRRQTLPEMVEAFLTARQLPPDLEREPFVRTGVEAMQAVEREWAES